MFLNGPEWDKRYRLLRPRVYHCLFWWSGDRDLAEELAQETEITAFERQSRRDLKAPFEAWVMLIARYKWLNARRQRRSYAELEQCRHLESREVISLTSICYRQCFEMLRQVDPQAAEAFEFYCLRERTLGEVAGVLGVSAPTICRRVARARRYLQDQLGGEH